MIRFLLITSLLLILSGWAEAPDHSSEYTALDLSFNKTFYWQNCGAEMMAIPAPEVDSYWIDSWTADGEEFLWYTPEKYQFVKGDVISTPMFFVQTSGEYDFVRYDGFYFCGESDWRNYVAYGWQDFGPISPFEPGYAWLTSIFYDTGYIRDTFLPLDLDWASKVRVSTHWFRGGLPLSGRPDCFTIENQP